MEGEHEDSLVHMAEGGKPTKRGGYTKLEKEEDGGGEGQLIIRKGSLGRQIDSQFIEDRVYREVMLVTIAVFMGYASLVVLQVPSPSHFSVLRTVCNRHRLSRETPPF